MNRYACAVVAAAFSLLLASGDVVAGEPPETATDAKTGATAVAAANARATRTHDRAVDRLQLDPTAVTGNRELPKVMSIVPWKNAEPPAGPDRPMGSLIEELLAPLDRDEFRREITYYRDLTSHSSLPAAAPGASEP